MCDHKNTLEVTTGSRRFSGVDVDDNLTERLLCLDCLENIDEPKAANNRNCRCLSCCDDGCTYTGHEKGFCSFCEELPDAPVFTSKRAAV